MKHRQYIQFKEKLFFTIDDVVNVLDIKRQSARVMCSRYVSEGIFVRIKNNFYVLEENLKRYTRSDMMKLSNYLQVPSYISLTTALIEWELTSQVQVDTFEACCRRKSQENNAGNITFRFFKISSEYYSGFVRKNGVFIAEKEKALMDAIYLYSFGKYSLDFDALEVDKLDKKKVTKYKKYYPEKTRKIIKKVCRI